MKLKNKKNKKNKLNEGHFVEALDRLNLIAEMMDTHLMNHPLIRKEKDIKKLINYSIINLMEAYQRVGNLLFIKQDETEGIKEVVFRRREDTTDRRVDDCKKL